MNSRPPIPAPTPTPGVLAPEGNPGRRRARRDRPRLPRLGAGGRGRWIAALAFAGLTRAGLGIGTALALRAGWDDLGARHPGYGVASVLGAFAVAEYGVRILEGMGAEALGQRYVGIVRRRWFALALSRPGTGPGARSDGAWQARLVNDLNALKNWVSKGFARAVSSGVILLCVAGALAIQRPVPTLALALLALPAWACGSVLARRLAGADHDARRERGRLARLVVGSLQARVATRLFGRERRELRRLGRASRRLAGRQVRRARFMAALRHLPDPFVIVAMAALTWPTGSAAPDPAAHGVFLLLLAGLAAGALRDLCLAWEQKVLFDSARRRLNLLARAAAPTHRTSERLPTPTPGSQARSTDPSEPIPSPAPAPAPALALRRVTVGDRFSEVHADLPRGGRAVLIGPSGAGKSTLLRTIAGLVPPEHGTVRVAGRDPAPRRGRRRAGSVQWLGGDVPLHPGSVRANLRYGCRQRDPDWLRKVADWCGIDSDPAAFPRGESTRVGAGGEGLSSSARARVALARAAAARPALLLVDDPVFLVDASARRALRRVLDELRIATVMVAAPGLNPLDATELWVLAEGRLETTSWPAQGPARGRECMADASNSPDYTTPNDPRKTSPKTPT